MSITRKGFLHGDLNQANVIVKENGKEIEGLIDWGDVVWSLVVNEVAIAMAYIGMRPVNKDNPIDSCVAILEGFCSKFPLTVREISFLRTLIACRVSQSIVIGLYSI